MSDAPEHGWMIHKAGRGWYRPNAHGYTPSTAEAGRFSHKDAMEYSHPNGWSGPRDGITIKHESEVDDRTQLPRIQLFTEDQLAAAIARAERAEAALAVAEEALRMIANPELSFLYESREISAAAIAKIAALKGGAAAEAAAFRRGQEHMMKRAAHICVMVEPETKPGNAVQAAIMNIGFTEARKLCERAIRALPVEEERK